MVEKRGHYQLTVLVIFVVLAFAIGYTTPHGNTGSASSQSSSLNYQGSVCVYKNGNLVDCSHNLLYNNGQNITRDLLGVGSNSPILNITLCNASAGCAAPVAGGSEAFTNFTGCGLTSAQGTYSALTNAPGNWSVVKTFTSTCDSITTNSTRLTNVTGGIFAGNTFSLVTLQTNDQLTINWTLMVS